MKILKALRIDWIRYGFEPIALVVGILVAFALDNWNKERKLQNEEFLNILSLLLRQRKMGLKVFSEAITSMQKMVMNIENQKTQEIRNYESIQTFKD